MGALDANARSRSDLDNENAFEPGTTAMMSSCVYGTLGADSLATSPLVERVNKVPGELVFLTWKDGSQTLRLVKCYPGGDTVDPRK